jgi:methyl-accepting chemotaxis protein
MIGKRILGVLFLLIGLSGLALSVVGVIIGRQVIEEVGTGVDQALILTNDTLDTVGQTLLVTKDVMGKIDGGIETAGSTAINLSKTLSETRPMLGEIAQVISEDVPEGIESMQTALPDVAEAAGAIDDALRVLDSFQVERQVFGVPISFDLGVDYNPENPLDETVLQLGESLEGLPNNLRDLQLHIDVANANLATIGQNVESIAADLALISESTGEIEPLIDEYIRIVTETGDLVRQARSSISDQLELAELILTLLFVWIGLNQAIPLYLSWNMFTTRSKPSDKRALKQG